MLRRPLLAALALGLLSPTGFAPLNLWFVTLACLAVLLWLVHEAPTLKSALLRGWVFGIGHFTIGNNWIQHAFDYQDRMPPVLGYFAVLALALYLAVYPALAMGLAWRFSRSVAPGDGRPDLGFVLAAAAAWIVSEWLRGTLFTGYPWNPLAVLWLPTPVAQTAAWIGTYALSGIAVLAAGTLLLGATRRFVPLTVTAAAFVACFLLPASAPRPAAGAPHVRVVQPNLGQENVDDPDYPERAIEQLMQGSGQPGAVPRLVVWPEGMVNHYVEDDYPDPRFYRRGDPRWVRGKIAAILGPRDVALISGNALFFDSTGKLTGAGNSVWPLEPSGMLGQRYDKAHLVPYGEYLPMRGLLEPLGLSRLVMGDVDFVPGPGAATLNVPGFGKVGVQVCYEIVFSGQVVDRKNRPDLLFNPSNDAWFGTWGPPEHLAQARLRAIEEGLPVLRSTPTGISAVIDARGKVLGSVPASQQGAIEMPLPRPLPPTLFSRVGNWMVLLVAGVLLLLAVAIRRRAS
ncbi:apolipoprotein N-acyltransferase [Sphingomonas xinjiangensis]|uniref:Apolipoprotein N-acyltransferase n=1 Tax=Sphingomonas xinjiangensis TaxID=643568 RepID=A0A840YDJ4_9SPHN|nr:apolipoprotein N-acyltransferase [Sphingomonas xinjiangensis]MBB5710069.1 apolipoprotein N-acyltransferase [Sphingomonas xinjiangensis]